MYVFILIFTYNCYTFLFNKYINSSFWCSNNRFSDVSKACWLGCYHSNPSIFRWKYRELHRQQNHTVDTKCENTDGPISEWGKMFERDEK